MSKSRSLDPPTFPFPFVAAGDLAPADAVIAEEMPEAVAAVLRQLLHEVRIWLSAPAAERRVLGEPPGVAQVPDAVMERVRRAFALLREEPGRDTTEAIALALAWTAEWLEWEGRAVRSSVVFHQAALLVMPQNVRVAYHIGRLLRRVAMYEMAEAWLQHTVEKAASERNWEHHALALSGLANLKRERGNFPEAVSFHRKALESARKHGARRLEGDALYDLAVMYFEHGELSKGIEYARGAIGVYGPGHSQLVRMANDIAWIWMHLHGEAELALLLFHAIEPRVQHPPFRAVLLANIARAAAEISEEQAYEMAWLEAYAYMQRQETDEGHAAAFGQMALASLASMQLERAREAARHSLEIAGRRREGRLVLMAEQMLDLLKGGVPAPERMRELFPAFTLGDVQTGGADRERNEDFAASLGNALRAREDGAPESPVRALVRGG